MSIPVQRLVLTGLILVLGAFLPCGRQAFAAGDYWQEHANRGIEVRGAGPFVYRTVDLDWRALDAVLAPNNGIGAELVLPAPDGAMQAFVLADSGVMPPELAARHPSIRSYVGTAADGTTARIDVSPLGLQATVHSRAGIWLVRPELLGRDSHYLSFRRADLPAGAGFRCDTHGDVTLGATDALDQPPVPTVTTGTVKRTYRAAVAANHQWVGAVASAMSPPQTPTVELGLAAVVNAMNRVNQVYEQDFSIHMSLIANNDLLIFPNETGDAFGGANFNNGNALNQITGKITGIVGAANYDIGHLFTTGSGGVAGLGVVCANSQKGRGTTGLTNGSTLQTDVFYIDYVAHEMGHQFGGDHTFNGSNSNCGNGNRTGSSAYEPGSGSTIQAYAGICGAVNNLQDHSDPYFHARSLLQMGNYSSTGTGGNCSVNVIKPDAPPAIAPMVGHAIPAGTPYALTGSATTEVAGATLTYGWEQYDLGAANNDLAADPGTGPIQRSWPPSVTPTRYLPRLSNLLAGTTAFGEILPTTSRTLTYRLTVRDNAPGGGSSSSADQALTVVGQAGPFVVTAPGGGSTWDYGSEQSVNWDVANTTQAPISCADVDIDLVAANPQQTDLIVLARLQGGAPNTGSATVTVPNVSATAPRVRVQCADNVFFNLSPAITVVVPDPLFQDGFDGPDPRR